MDDKGLLELCLKVSGAFESAGGASYTSIAGNFDHMGLSVGVLQWNAGQGTLQALLQAIGAKMGWDKAATFFVSDIHHLSVLPPQDAIAFCLDHYIETGTTNVDPAAKSRWGNFLGQPESIAAQIELASNGVLGRAKVLAAKYCPDATAALRPIVFFFDLVTQSGGMQNKRGKVDPVPSGMAVDIADALEFAHQHDLKCAGIWEVKSQNDALAQLLLHYAYQRSLLSNPEYVWDALSRRGTIACRAGIVHTATVNLSQILD